MPPGTYEIKPKIDYEPGDKFENGTPAITDPGKVPGHITTPPTPENPNDTERTALFIHGPGPSKGCVACESKNVADTVKSTMDQNLNSGSTWLTVREIK